MADSSEYQLVGADGGSDGMVMTAPAVISLAMPAALAWVGVQAVWWLVW